MLRRTTNNTERINLDTAVMPQLSLVLVEELKKLPKQAKQVVGALIHELDDVRKLTPSLIMELFEQIGGKTEEFDIKSILSPYFDFDQIQHGINLGDLPKASFLNLFKTLGDAELSQFDGLNQANLRGLKRADIERRIIDKIKNTYKTDSLLPIDLFCWIEQQGLRVVDRERFVIFLSGKKVKREKKSSSQANKLTPEIINSTYAFVAGIFEETPELKSMPVSTFTKMINGTRSELPAWVLEDTDKLFRRLISNIYQNHEGYLAVRRVGGHGLMIVRRRDS